MSTLERLKKNCKDKERLNAIQRFLEEVKIMEQEEPSSSTSNAKPGKPRVPFQRRGQKQFTQK